MVKYAGTPLAVCRCNHLVGMKLMEVHGIYLHAETIYPL